MKSFIFHIEIYDWDVEVIQAMVRDASQLEKRLIQFDCPNDDIKETVEHLAIGNYGGNHYFDRTLRQSIITLSNCDTIEKLVITLFHELRHLTDRILETMGIDDFEAAACLEALIAKKVVPKFFYKRK